MLFLLGCDIIILFESKNDKIVILPGEITIVKVKERMNKKMRKEKWKNFLQKYKHAWVLSYFIIYSIWFIFLEQRTQVEHYPIHMHLDDVIPFCEYFIVPYLLWFAFIAATMLYFCFADVEGFYKCCALLFTGMTICLIIYTFFPNEQNLRPVTFERSNMFIDWVQMIYHVDTSTNVCPSIHVLNSIGAFCAIWESPNLRKRKWLIASSGLLALSICMSTVFLKQHSMVDVLCGAGLAIALYALVYRINYPKLLAGLAELQNKNSNRIRKNNNKQNEIG